MSSESPTSTAPSAFRKGKWPPLLLLMALAGGLWISTCGLWDIRGPDESRYTQIARELLHRSNWLVLTIHGQPYDQKPPLPFWIFALALKIAGGINTWFLRLPGILAGMGIIVMTYLLAWEKWGRRAAFFSGLCLLTAPVFLDDAPAVELNMLYTFFTTAALFVFLVDPGFPFQQEKLSRGRTALFWLAVSAAFFVKGPLELLVVFSAVGFSCLSSRDLRPWRAVRFLWGFPALVGLIVIWQIAQRQAFGTEFIEEQINGQTVERFLAGTHHEHWWFYFPRLFTTIFFPWAFLLTAALIRLRKERKLLSVEFAPLVGWMAIPFLVLVLAYGKRVSYVLPLLPAAAMVSGWYMDAHFARLPLRPWIKWIPACIGLILAALLVSAGIVILCRPTFLVRPDVDPVRLHGWVWIASGLASAVGTILLTRRSTPTRAACLLAFLTLLFFLVDFAGVHPGLDPQKSSRSFSNELMKILAERNERTVLTIPECAEPEFHVYGDYRLVIRKRKKIDLHNQAYPNILVLPQRDTLSSGPELERSGWQLKSELLAAKEPMAIYVRTSGTVERKP